MIKLENKEKITEIVMKPVAIAKCQIGQDWFKNDLEITFVPDKYYPDYMIVNDWIINNVDGKELNIEEVIELVFDYLMQYEPKDLTVVNKIQDSKTHFDVVVIKKLEVTDHE